jgi:hypothetical protein
VPLGENVIATSRPRDRRPSRTSRLFQHAFVAQRVMMTHSQACRPCAKRKVRCDRLEPCSNCKRRKTDRCIYPASTPTDRIRQLESIVRELGGNPNNDDSTSPVQGSLRVVPKQMRANAPTELRSNDPIILEEDGEVQYLES